MSVLRGPRAPTFRRKRPLSPPPPTGAALHPSVAEPDRTVSLTASLASAVPNLWGRRGTPTPAPTPTAATPAPMTPHRADKQIPLSALADMFKSPSAASAPATTSRRSSESASSTGAPSWRRQRCEARGRPRCLPLPAYSLVRAERGAYVCADLPPSSGLLTEQLRRIAAREQADLVLLDRAGFGRPYRLGQTNRRSCRPCC